MAFSFDINDGPPPSNPSTVAIHLDWACGDWGHNEGAGCAAAVLGPLVGIPIPDVAGMLLGEVWKRGDMMSAAKHAFKLGHYEAAVSAAICSQVHNQPVHDYLVQHRDRVKEWFTQRI
jgi:hypothetical protein